MDPCYTYTRGFTPRYGYGMGYVPHPYEAGGSSWQTGGSSWQAHGGVGPSELEAYEAGGSKHHEPGHSLDFEGMPPPVRPQVPLDVLNTIMGGLELQNMQIQWKIHQTLQGTSSRHMEERRRSHTATPLTRLTPFIDLESEREIQAYNLMKEREFLHSPAFDPAFLHQIGMAVEFDTIFERLGWSRVAPVHELGSHLLTIQIFGTLQIVDYGITFCCFGRDFDIYWKDLANYLGFHE